MKRFVLSVLAGFVASPAMAHVLLEVRPASFNAEYKAVFRVPHGCHGAATTALRIEIPEGFINAKPMPKPGWTLSIKTGNYAKAYKMWSGAVASGATEIDFTGGNLPDAYYDEFVVTGYVADSFKPGDAIFFPVIQECGAVSNRWVEIPNTGQNVHDLKHPAPHVDVTARPQ